MNKFNLKNIRGFVLLSLVLIGVVLISNNIFAEDTYTINESGELIINADTDYGKIIDYSLLNNSYRRNVKGRYIDRKTGLNFKNRFFYMKFKNEGLVYKRYIRSNEYFYGLEYYLKYYPVYKNGKPVQIIYGAYQ
jgi:hypothetical protein